MFGSKQHTCIVDRAQICPSKNIYSSLTQQVITNIIISDGVKVYELFEQYVLSNVRMQRVH